MNWPGLADPEDPGSDSADRFGITADRVRSISRRCSSGPVIKLLTPHAMDIRIRNKKKEEKTDSKLPARDPGETETMFIATYTQRMNWTIKSNAAKSSAISTEAKVTGCEINRAAGTIRQTGIKK